MIAGEHATALERCYDRLAAGDPTPMSRFLAHDVTYHLPGRHLGGGTLHGRATLLRRLAAAAGWCDAPPAIELLHAFDAAGFVVSIERLRADRRGRALDQTVSVVWRLAGPQCVEVWSHFADQAACDAFWGGFAPPDP